jgi:predicted transcriptional regulator
VAYPEAASFVKFLIDRYGKEKFLEAYKTLQNSEDLHERQKNVERLAEIYGVSFQELAGQWEDFLAGAGAASDQ